MGSLTIGSSCSPVTPAPKATSASRFAISTACSPEAATPVVISTAPANRRRNASISGPATNSANVEVATTRSCSGAPCAARTAACASAPSMTIWDAMPTSRVPPGVSVMPAWLRVISWSPRSCRRAVIACDTADSLTLERARRRPHRPEPGDQDEGVQLRQCHRTLHREHQRTGRASMHLRALRT